MRGRSRTGKAAIVLLVTAIAMQAVAYVIATRAWDDQTTAFRLLASTAGWLLGVAVILFVADWARSRK